MELVYELIGLKNYVSCKTRKKLCEIAEERYDKYLLSYIVMDELTLKVHHKIVEKLSEEIAEDFINEMKNKQL